MNLFDALTQYASGGVSIEKSPRAAHRPFRRPMCTLSNGIIIEYAHVVEAALAMKVSKPIIYSYLNNTRDTKDGSIWTYIK